MEEKGNFYRINNIDNSIFEIEKKRFNNFIRLKTYKLEELYYSLDSHNIFKRIDRYYLRKRFIALFSIMSLFNISEIILSISFLFVQKESENYYTYQRIMTLFSNMIYILLIQLMSYFTVSKTDINTYIYY